jgi:hypothetical protein
MFSQPLFPRLATTALLGLTLLGSLAEAKKPQPVPPPAAAAPAPVLTVEEVRCEGLGKMTEMFAQARDNGVAYLTVKAALQQTPVPTQEVARLTRASLILLPAVYDATLLTPQQIRQRTELGCLQDLTSRHETAPTTTKDLRD